MPQILILIIALIIRLAVEGSKEVGGSSRSSRSSSNYKRTTYRPGPSRTQSLNDMLKKQSTSDKPSSTIKPVYTKTETPVYQEPTTKPVEESYKIDTDDYDSFTNTEVDQIEQEESFVEETVSRVSTYEMRANKIKFMIFSLVYCMYEDDNEFTRKEKRMFKMISRVASVNLKSKDTDEIKGFVDSRPNLDDIVRLQQKYNLDITDVVETLSGLRKHLKGNDQYRPIIERIEKRFQYEL